ncbi:MAG: divergent polysaccharide deacetylase family protein [Desulfobacteraceae bacterium]|nr:divergent polysaccharide deacetylase family protein [Desulfobacteraceae bacterium]
MKKDKPDTRNAGLSFALIICAAAVLILNQLSGVEGAKPPDQVFAPALSVPKVPEFEIYPKEDIRPKRITPRPGISLPKAAIIIDDIGYDAEIAEKLANLDKSLTFSVLPNAPLKRKIAESAAAKGIQVMLHLPMEPMEYPAANPGPGALFSSMSPKQMLAQLERDLDAVPYVRGVNNHMGSRLTATSSPMYHLMSVLKKRQMFLLTVSPPETADVCLLPGTLRFRLLREIYFWIMCRRQKQSEHRSVA